MIAALSFPKLLQGIILVGTGARLRVAEDVLIRARKGASFAEYAYSSDTPVSVKREAEREFRLTSPEVRYHDFLACNNFDIMDQVHEIALPTLIICGQDDKLTPVKYSQFLHQKIPDSWLKTIPLAGHMVMWEQPEACNQAIQDFLNRL
jgi:pimeloyl-ACP methyl ester carboxylesterase